MIDESALWLKKAMIFFERGYLYKAKGVRLKA